MQLRFDAVSRPGFFDHGRLLTDFFDSEYGKRGARLQPPWAALSRLGADLLHATIDDHGACQIRRSPNVAMRLRERAAFTAFHGRVTVNCLLAAVAAGRTDLAERFRARFTIHPEQMLRWLVLYGINEHGLWHALEKGFVRSLLSPSLQIGIGKLPLLAALILLERPDLAGRFGTKGTFNGESFSEWLDTEGRAQYGLWWCQEGQKLHPAFSDQDPDSQSAAQQAWRAFLKKSHLHAPTYDSISGAVRNLVGESGSTFTHYKLEFSTYAGSTVPILRGATETFVDRVDFYSPEVTLCLPTTSTGRRRYLLEVSKGDIAQLRFSFNGRSLEPIGAAGGKILEIVVPEGRGDLPWNADVMQVSAARGKPDDDPYRPWLGLSAIWVPGTPQ